MLRFRFWILAGASVSCLACSTVSTPVLRHETGESLGGLGHFRVIGYYESSRLFAFVPPGGGYSASQDATIFQGSLLGGRAEAGVLRKLDVFGGATLSQQGGGWQGGAKYSFFSLGALSVAAMAEYSVGSGNGTVTYTTTTGTSDASETLSANTINLSVPVSYRFAPQFAAYGGLMLLRSGVVGAVGSSAVSSVAYDTGLNLGLRFTFGAFDADLETAFVRLYDPFQDTATRVVPFIGLGAGVVF